MTAFVLDFKVFILGTPTILVLVGARLYPK